jgi:hypothetical protein
MRRANLLVRLSLGLLLTIACGGAGDDDPAAADAGARTDASADGGGSACPRLPAAPDRVRPMIVSKPYNPDSSPANAYQVLAVGLDGTITDSGQRFEMRRAIYGEFTFTPDGKVGLLAQNDGTIGVVGFDGMIPTVIHAAFTGDFYASRVALDATGEYAYIVDANFRNNGGGLFRSAIGCDGSLGAPERLVDSKLAEFMFVEDGGTALVVARDVADSAVGHDVHRVTLTRHAGGQLGHRRVRARRSHRERRGAVARWAAPVGRRQQPVHRQPQPGGDRVDHRRPHHRGRGRDQRPGGDPGVAVRRRRRGRERFRQRAIRGRPRRRWWGVPGGRPGDLQRRGGRRCPRPWPRSTSARCAGTSGWPRTCRSVTCSSRRPAASPTSARSRWPARVDAIPGAIGVAP